MNDGTQLFKAEDAYRLFNQIRGEGV
jgi:hypothetical protein